MEQKHLRTQNQNQQFFPVFPCPLFFFRSTSGPRCVGRPPVSVAAAGTDEVCGFCRHDRLQPQKDGAIYRGAGWMVCMMAL